MSRADVPIKVLPAKRCQEGTQTWTDTLSTVKRIPKQLRIVMGDATVQSQQSLWEIWWVGGATSGKPRRAVGERGDEMGGVLCQPTVAL
eukprot:5600843-Amphidinium_carterae.2